MEDMAKYDTPTSVVSNCTPLGFLGKVRKCKCGKSLKRSFLAPKKGKWTLKRDRIWPVPLIVTTIRSFSVNGWVGGYIPMCCCLPTLRLGCGDPCSSGITGIVAAAILRALSKLKPADRHLRFLLYAIQYMSCQQFWFFTCMDDWKESANQRLRISRQ